MDYRSAGVDIDAAQRAKSRIRDLARATFDANTLGDIGSFGGLFRLDTSRYRRPVLVASTDGVGTKLKIAFQTGRHDTVGYDLVSHCVNDILVQGARPLFFLDYLAVGRLSPDIVECVVSGIARACHELGVVLIGGETAELPGFYAADEYDLAGTIVGVVEEDHVITGEAVRPGDLLLGLASTGLHTNGYSLARQIVLEKQGVGAESFVSELGATVADALLAPHRCYLPLVEPLLDSGWIRAMAHITGGGLTENIPRVLPKGTAARVRLGAWTVPPIFRYLQEKGEVAAAEMLRTFNMGVGIVLIVAPADRDRVVGALEQRGETVMHLGEVTEGDGVVGYEGSL